MSNSVNEYVAALSGWRAAVVTELRRSILDTRNVAETFKWGHPVYEAGGPVCLVKAHSGHVTLGFWRGALLTDLDARLVPHGGFEMASIKLKGPGEISPTDIRRLVLEAVALNLERGDPLRLARA
jgi:hypothetical protein